MDGEDSCPRGETNWNSLDSNLDFDGDGCKDDKPEDDDVDNDGWTDEEEGRCGTDSKNAASQPADSDGDEICDALDTISDGSQDDKEDEVLKGIDWQVVVSVIIGLGGVWASNRLYQKQKDISRRLDEGSKRFEKGERRFDHIEDEMEDLESMIQSTQKKS